MTDRELFEKTLGYMESVGQMDMHPEEWAIAVALRERLAQPEQEPVAWMHPDGRVWTFGRGFDKSTFTIPLYAAPQRREEQEPVATVQRVQDLFIGYLEKSLPVGTPLYTAPPRREWVGLTRTERFEIEKAMSKYYDYRHECKTVCLPEFAAAIEAKLREKNT